MRDSLKKTAKIGLLVLPVAIGVGVVGAALMPQAHASAQTSTTVTSQAVDKPDGNNDATDSAVQNTPVTLTSDQAKKIAETTAKGAASSVTKEDENGTIVYNVKVAGKEVKVDANSGKIVATDSETNDQSDKQDTKDVNGAENQSNDTSEANDTPDNTATQKQ